MSLDEDKLREQLRRQEELAEKKAMTPKPNPLGEERLRPKPTYEELQQKIKDLERQNENISETMAGKEKPPRDVNRYNGGPAELGLGANRGGLASSRYIKHATEKYVKGEWDEEDMERYLFYEAGWLDKAHLRARQIARFFKQKENRKVKE